MVHAWQLGHSFGRPAALAGRRARCCCLPVLAAAAPSTELGKESRIGKQPIPIPKGATYSFDGSNFKVKGPNGEMQKSFDGSLIEIKEENDALRIYKKVESRRANETHGLVRSLMASMVLGVTEGFTKTLSLLGVGYRASASGKELTMNLGYSQPVVMEIPDGITIQVEKLTTLHIKGYDKEQVGQYAAAVRARRPPEPYKGKGVRYVDEFVRKKEGKRGKK